MSSVSSSMIGGILSVAVLLLAGCEDSGSPDAIIETVTGPVSGHRLGWALSHEHVLIDWVGADKISRERYSANEAFAVMLPYFQNLRDAGVSALFDTTPPYLGRDPVLLRRLSEASGVFIIASTGIYREQYIPDWARTGSAEQIADVWIAEWEQGIESTGIRPGLIKIALNNGEVTELHWKLFTAAALASRATGLPIACHTTSNEAAFEELRILASLGLPGTRLIILHADVNYEPELHAKIVERGAWLSFDQIKEELVESRVKMVRDTVARWPDNLLISQDAGWYNVGDARGGRIVPYDWLPREFVPRLLASGVTPNQIETLLKVNPVRAFAIRRPKPDGREEDESDE